jgi:hypothetical protein
LSPLQILHARAHALDVDRRFASMIDRILDKHRRRGSGTQSGELSTNAMGKTCCARARGVYPNVPFGAVSGLNQREIKNLLNCRSLLREFESVPYSRININKIPLLHNFINLISSHRDADSSRLS